MLELERNDKLTVLFCLVGLNIIPLSYLDFVKLRSIKNYPEFSFIVKCQLETRGNSTFFLCFPGDVLELQEQFANSGMILLFLKMSFT